MLGELNRAFMRFLTSFLLPAVILATVFMAVPAAYATSTSPTTLLPDGAWAGCDIATGQFQAKCIPELVGYLIQLIVGMISAFFLINVMIAGYQIAMGSYTGEKAQGKDRLQWSIIGFIVCVCSFLILDFVLTIIAP